MGRHLQMQMVQRSRTLGNLIFGCILSFALTVQIALAADSKPVASTPIATAASTVTGDSLLFINTQQSNLLNRIYLHDLVNLPAFATFNAHTASAFAATPTGCSSGQFATGIDVQGNLSCDVVDGLPDQTGNSGKFLGTDGTTASWADVISGINALTGDVTASGTGSVAATVVAVGGSTAADVHNATMLANSADSNDTPSAIVIRDSSGNFVANQITSDLIGNVTGAVTGNASTASAFAANPTDCSAGNFATAIAANGNLTCSVPAGTGVTSVDFSVPSSSILSVSGNPVTSTGTIALATTGTSGGVPYFSSTSKLASSALLSQYAIMIGGGAGNAPTVLGSTGTSHTLVHGNASGAPSFGAVDLTADVTGLLPNGNLANTSTTVNGTSCTLGSSCTPHDSTKFDTVGAFGSTPTANGISVSGNTITPQPGDDAHPGMLSTSAQKIAGQKEFTAAQIWDQVSTPSTPSSGTNAFYVKSDGNLYTKNSSGTELQITGVGIGNLTDWKSYTPTVSGGFGTISGLAAFYRQDGDTYEVVGAFTGGTTSGLLGTISFPNSGSIDPTKLPINANTSSICQKVGDLQESGAANTVPYLLACSSTSTSVVYVGGLPNANNFLTPHNINLVLDSANVEQFSFKVPIQGLTNSIAYGTGMAATDWNNSLTFTPSASAFGSISNAAFISRREGPNLHVRGKWKNGTVGGAAGYIQLPSSYTINTSALVATGSFMNQLGWGNGSTSAASAMFATIGSGFAWISDGSTTNEVFMSAGGGTTSELEVCNGNVCANSNAYMSVDFLVPVSVGGVAWTSTPYGGAVSTAASSGVRIDAAQVTCSSSASIVSQMGSSTWVSSIGNISSGACAVTLSNGYTATPYCWSDLNTSSQNQLLTHFSASSSTAASLSCTDNSTLGTACTTFTANIFCLGAH